MNAKEQRSFGLSCATHFKLHLEFTALHLEFTPSFAENKIFPAPCNEIGSEWKAEGFSGLVATKSDLCSSFCALEHGQHPCTEDGVGKAAPSPAWEVSAQNE